MSHRQEQEFQRLREVNRHIAEGRIRIHRQQRLLEDMDGDEPSREIATKLLLELEETLIQWEKSRDLIRRKLDSLKR